MLNTALERALGITFFVAAMALAALVIFKAF